jgi:hypothetical protein
MITHLIKNHCVKNHIDDLENTWFYHFVKTTHAFSTYGIKKNPGMYEALELLGDERTVLGVVRLGWLGFKNLFQQSDLPYEGSFCCNFDNMIFFCYF